MLAICCSMAFAETPAETEARLLEQQAAEEAAALEGQGASTETDDGEDDPEEGEGWARSPILKPDVGLAMYSANGNLEVGIALGAQVGLSYTQRTGLLAGRTRVGGTLTRTLGGPGTDLRVGTFLGPQAKLVGFDAGVDVFRNGYDGVVLSIEQSAGVDVPLTLRVGPRLLHGLVNVTPAWLDKGSRRVDWSTAEGSGFGHELGWLLGGAISTPVMGVQAGYSERYVAGGTSKGLYAGISFGR